LLVRPTDGQILDRSDLVVDDRAVAHGGADGDVALLTKSIEKLLEVLTLDDDSFSDHRDLRSALVSALATTSGAASL
jgi:hypothetical protein